VQYDRLAPLRAARPAALLLEPYSHEFINLPHESYLINDYGPSIRRVLIGKEHSNSIRHASWYGDTIGFWDGAQARARTRSTCIPPTSRAGRR
jgi:hypothetical protein